MGVVLSAKPCDLEVIPFQVTFRRIHEMFEKMSKGKYDYSLIEQICCRSYANPIVKSVIPKEDGCQLNDRQREAVGKALVDKNKLLLIQGPPGTGKSKTCVELIKQFVDLNYNTSSPADGPTILYCAPSNEGVNVGACAMLKYPEVRILRIYGAKIEAMKFPELAAIPFLAKRQVPFENEDTDKVPEVLEEHSLHIKIRDKSSKKHEIREFIKCEDNLKTLKNYEELQEKSDEYFALKKNAEKVVLKEAQVIFCTCAEAGSNRMNTRKIKQCIIDECGMCTEPETLLPMILSKKIILVGDHKQLQPVVLNKTAESLGLKISMFQRLIEDEKMTRYCITLTEQYRMHPSICEFPSNQFYNGKLVAAKEILERRWPGKLPSDIWKQHPEENQRCVFIHVEGIEDTSGIDSEGSYTGSKSNKKEAKKVKFVVNKLLQSGIPTDEIMVLTPYRTQIDCCRKEGTLQPVEITTIHGSQGRECNVVILTTVRSLPKEDIPDHPSHLWVNENMGFLTDEHLMNVAISRAKEAFCIIGNKELLRKHKMWKSLLDHYTKHNCVV